MSSATASLNWFAQHELRLAWRDWSWLLSGGRRGKDAALLVGLGLFALAVHGIAYLVLKDQVVPGLMIDKAVLVPLTGAVLLSFTMMLSQAIEMVTRSFYVRDDLDLILTSPAPVHDLFTVRIAMLAVSNAILSGLMAAPFIHVAAMLGGPHWLAGYVVVLAAAFLATGAAVFIVLGLFQLIGPRRTRLVAQIVAAVVSASFLIGVQVIAILALGSVSRWSVINSEWVRVATPAVDGLLWLPAWAASGQISALSVLMAVTVFFFWFASWLGAVRFQAVVVSAAGMGEERSAASAERPAFAARSSHWALIEKEWKLLARDPWLVSQSLMQVFYLIPPALMLWVSYGSEAHTSAILAPVIVMAVGQLAGGLAWLAISGEDAPDLVATAPVRRFAVLSAKVQAVLAIVLAIASPFVLAMAFLSLWGAFVTLFGVVAGASCAIIIQIWFRAQANRTQFRRRQVASKASTFCEAFASILCAATAGVAAAGSWLFVVPAVLVGCVMAVAWLLSPKAD